MSDAEREQRSVHLTVVFKELLENRNAMAQSITDHLLETFNDDESIQEIEWGPHL